MVGPLKGTRYFYNDKKIDDQNHMGFDHGQGLASLYGHLSSFSVAQGSVVKKGDVIAYSGRTGLANGDHQHFSILVHGIFVNPLEWWDARWIKNNITRKLDLIKKAE